MFPALEPPDSHSLQAAKGWLELGNWREARNELDRIRPSHRGHPEVLKARWDIHMRAGEYAACLPIAMSLRGLVPNDPLGWKLHARCFYFMQRYDAAAAVLHPALAKFPDSFEIHYDAACYACLTGDLVMAKSLLDLALVLDRRPECRRMAMSDVNLQRLWPEIGAD